MMEWDHRNYSYGLARAEKAWWGLLRNATREEVKEERRSVGREGKSCRWNVAAYRHRFKLKSPVDCPPIRIDDSGNGVGRVAWIRRNRNSRPRDVGSKVGPGNGWTKSTWESASRMNQPRRFSQILIIIIIIIIIIMMKLDGANK